MKRFMLLTVILTVLLIPSALLAANKLAVGDVETAGNTITVPLNIANADNMVAVDIPLQFSEGVELKAVHFENTRVDYFDLKIADIDNEHRTVAIGLINQITASSKPALDAGEGVVAFLEFEVLDNNVNSIEINGVEMQNPHHDLMFIYHVMDGGKVVDQVVEGGEFEPVTVALSPNGNDGLPTKFALNQNYPNPFNPSTKIAFELPQASEYRLSVFNVLGQTVSEFSGEAEAGVHEIEWGGSEFASGVYFYKLEAGSFTDTKKMVMIK